MKKTNVILCVLLAVVVIGAAVLGIQLVNTHKELTQTEETLKTTQLSLDDMTVLQGETAATLSQTEETLTATSKELDDTKGALADMTALQEETAATLSQTEETLTATSKELDDTKGALTDMTALQEETAATLSQTEETLTATSKELDDTQAALADMTALQEETAATLSQTEEMLAATSKELDDTKAALVDMTALKEETEAELNRTRETLEKNNAELQDARKELETLTAPQDEPAAAEEPAWTYYEFGGYGTALLDGWTKTMESEDGQLQYFYYGNSFVMIGAMKVPMELKTEAEILDAYEGVKAGYISSGMTNVTHEVVQVNGYKAYLVHGNLRAFPVDMMVYYVPGQENMYSFSYARLDGDTERHEQIINLAIRHTAVVKEMEVAPAEAEDDAQEAAPAAAPAVDYPDDAKFEADLNAGKNLVGKTVTFTVTGYKPNSAFGHNLWAGEHLNFVSNTAPGYDVGDRLTVRVTEVNKTLGSYIIKYEVVK